MIFAFIVVVERVLVEPSWLVLSVSCHFQSILVANVLFLTMGSPFFLFIHSIDGPTLLVGCGLIGVDIDGCQPSDVDGVCGCYSIASSNGYRCSLADNVYYSASSNQLCHCRAIDVKPWRICCRTQRRPKPLFLRRRVLQLTRTTTMALALRTTSIIPF